MNITQLKENIQNNKVIPNVLVFKCSSKSALFIFHQYLNRYSINNSLEIKFVDSLEGFTSNSLFDKVSDNGILYIYDADKLDQLPSSLCSFNVWIRCNNISKKLYEQYEDIIVDVPKLEDWQIKDYINYNLPKLCDKYKERLYDSYKTELFRLELEIDKLKLFNEDVYTNIEDQLYVDSTTHTIFDITDCILKHDIETLCLLKDSIKYIDIDPFGLLKILLNNFRYVIDIQLAKNPTPEYVRVSNKQFWAIKNYSCGFYSKEELVDIYKFLLSLDNKIKSGEIPVDMVIDYIICKIMLM